MSSISYSELLVIVLLTAVKGSCAASFTVLDNCGYTVWPGFLSDTGMAIVPLTGFELLAGTTRVVEIPAQWSGHVWGRTGCTFGADGTGSCLTGDCGGQLHCDGTGLFPTASLEKLTQNPAGLDWYDVSLINNFFLPPPPARAPRLPSTALSILTSTARDDDGDADDNVLACKNACRVTDIPQYCCIQAHAHPNSELFKTGPLNCADAYYAVTFCPYLPTARMSLATSPVASAGTSNSNGPGKIIIGDSKVGKVTSPAASSIATVTSILILIGLLLVKTFAPLTLSG